MAAGSRKRAAQVRTGKTGGSPKPQERKRIPRNVTRGGNGRLKKK